MSNKRIKSLGVDEDDLYDEEYYDDDDLLDEYTHERLPTEPQQLNLELPESNLDLTITFNSILTSPDPPESAQEYVFSSVLLFALCLSSAP